MERLKSVAAKRTLKLTHLGRKTGKPYEVTIWFVVEGERLYLATANTDRHWVRNVQKTPSIKLQIAGQAFDGRARFLADPAEHELVLARMREKYRMYRLTFPVMRLLTRTGITRTRLDRSKWC